MSKTYIIGDIHGALLALKELLNKVKINQEDTIIFLGDYVDGWSDSAASIDFLIDLQSIHKCIFIKGNHDDLLLKYLTTKTYNEEWLKHGGKSTLNLYQDLDIETQNKHIFFLENLKDYHLDSHNRLYIHAGFTNPKGIDFEYFKPMYYWDRSLWELVLALDPLLETSSIYYPKRLLCYHEIYIGHTPVSRINSTTPVNKANIWNIDTAAAFKGCLSMICAETKEVWQSTPVYQLYPNENGRN
ncbi:MAG: metallophosphoesterase family protein [Flavobacterium sp.]